MAPGSVAWLAFIGTDAGSCAHIRKVRIVSRNPASYKVEYLDSPSRHQRNVFDRNKDVKLHGSWTEAKAWMVKKMQDRVDAATDVLNRRIEVLNSWMSVRYDDE